jgi:hypothetical protein
MIMTIVELWEVLRLVGKRRRRLALKLRSERMAEALVSGLVAEEIDEGLPTGRAEALVDFAEGDVDGDAGGLFVH